MKWIRDFKKASKVFESFLVLLLALMITLTGATVFHVQKQLEQNAIVSVKSVFNKSVNLINSDLLSARNSLYRYSRYTSWDDKDTTSAMLDAFLSDYNCRQAYFIGADGSGYDAKGNALTVKELPFEDFVLAHAKDGISPFYIDEEGICVVAMGVPVLKNGGLSGAFYAVYPMETFSSNTLAKSIRGEAYFYLLDQTNDMMISAAYHTDETGVNLTTLPELMKAAGYSEANSQALLSSPMSEKEDFQIRASIDNTDFYLFFLPVEESPSWYMCGLMPVSVIKEESNNTLSLIGSIIEMLAVISVLIIALILYFLLRRQALEKREQKEKEFQNAIYNALSEKSDVVVCIFDRDSHTLEQVFQNSLRILGRPNEEYLSHPELFEELCSMADPSLYRRLCEGEIDEDEVYQFAMAHPGSQAVFNIRLTVKSGILIAGRRKYMFYFEDITQDILYQETLREAAEKAGQASRAKSEFLSNMSHEIRTPMNAIMGMLEIMEQNPNNTAKLQSCMGKIRLSAAHLLHIINDILEISRIESGKVTLNPEPFSLSDLVSNVNSIIRPQAEAKRHDFVIHIHHISHDRFTGDWMRLNQILINLLNNSVKYTPAPGHITLYIEENAGNSPATSRVRFSVTDDGIGMSQEFLNRLGSPFEQERSQLHIQEGGTGLGLSIVFQLVKLMGGTIAVDSTLGVGTVITVDMEFSLAPENAANGDRTDIGDRSDSKTGVAGMRILLADPDPQICQETVSSLRALGVRVDCASNLTQAAARAEQTSYQFLIADRFLDGREVSPSRLLEQLMPKIAGHAALRPPVICLSAYDQADVIDDAYEEGNAPIPFLYIEKPLFPCRLLETLQTARSDKARSELQGSAGTAGTIARPSAKLPNLRVLVVEDNDLNREITLEFLKMAEIPADCAVNGQEALDKFLASPAGAYDLILMDLQMPVMDGLTATARIRESAHPQAKTIPILAMTANAFEEDVNRCLSAGMNGHLAKPLDSRSLVETIERYVKPCDCR